MSGKSTFMLALLALARAAAAAPPPVTDFGEAWGERYQPGSALRAQRIDPLGGSASGDPTFTPLGAPASNLTGPNFTPPFPAYPSGHAGFGGALFQVLRRVYRTDAIAFTFVSDEYNGITTDNQGHVRPLAPRSFASLSAAEEENGQSRIYLGIHWGSTRPRASPSAVGSPTTSSTTPCAHCPERHPTRRLPCTRHHRIA